MLLLIKSLMVVDMSTYNLKPKPPPTNPVFEDPCWYCSPEGERPKLENSERYRLLSAGRKDIKKVLYRNSAYDS